MAKIYKKSLIILMNIDEEIKPNIFSKTPLLQSLYIRKKKKIFKDST